MIPLAPSKRRPRHGALLAALVVALTACPVPASEERPPPPGSGHDRPRLTDVERIIRPLRTVTETADGRRELTLGTGFIVGRHYFTVEHNLAGTVAPPAGARTIYLEGTAVAPSFTDAGIDLAVFALPDGLCQRYCNDLALVDGPELLRDQKVYWLPGEDADGERTWQEGRVLHYAIKGDGPAPGGTGALDGCEGNLIVEVDTPFVSGSSGGPVLDAATGGIVGIIQGSVERGGVRSGYFKPVSCLTSILRTVRQQQP
jgi:hypothetical protein